MSNTLTEAASLDAVRKEFRWQLPDRFNIATACCTRWAAIDPERIALREWGGKDRRKTSYGELETLSGRFANVLTSLGLQTGDRVAIILPQCLETVVAHLGIYKAAMIAVPLARLFETEALQYRLGRAGVKAVITNRDGAGKLEAIRGNLPDLRHVIRVEKDVEGGSFALPGLLEKASARFEARYTEPDTPALIIFTSGTTGPAKGALHGHRVLIGHLPGVQLHHEFMPKPGDMAWTPADWAWAGGLLNILLPCLYLGVPVIYGGLDRFDPERAFALMAQMRVANAFIPPTALRLMKASGSAPAIDRLALRSIGSGGESLGQDSYEWARSQLGVTINEFYGQTECNLVLSSCAALGVTKAGAIGKPVPGHEVAVIDSDGQVCAPGDRGQVAIRRPDPVMFLGYWEDDKASREKFLGDWLLTGDQCVMDEEGYFTFVGRDDDIINLAGYRVGPGEIEDCLVSHPSVRLAVAVGKPDPMKTEIVKAYVVLAEGTGDDALRESIQAHVKKRLAANIFPREIEFVDDIPLTTTGKVIRRTFREKARSESLTKSGQNQPVGATANAPERH